VVSDGYTAMTVDVDDRGAVTELHAGEDLQ
jgi:hypothetical protein